MILYFIFAGPQLVKVPPKTVTSIIDAAISGTIAQIEDDTGAYVSLLSWLQPSLLLITCDVA